MAMVGVDSGSMYRRTHNLSHLAWSWVGGRLAQFYIHQMNRVNSLHWLWHDDSTISIVLELLLLFTIHLLGVISRSVNCSYSFALCLA